MAAPPAILCDVNFRFLTYIGGDTPIHRCDARVKIALLLAYSIGIFFVHSWWVMAAFVAVVVVAAALARIPLRRIIVPLVPVIFLALFAVLFAVMASPDMAGLASGLLVAIRMIALVAASFVVCYTTTASEQLGAFAWFIEPLRVLKVPVDDIAFTLALALRFIPVIYEELVSMRRAQQARGGAMSGLGFSRRLSIWGAAFSAVFVGLFRHADALASAMDARCYGAAARRTSLPK